MDVKQALQTLWRQRVILLLTVLAALSVAFAGSSLAPERYTASATLRFLTARGGSPGNVRYEVAYADRLMNTYRRMATSGAMRQQLAARLGTPDLPDIEVDVLANTELMRISATSPNPQLASDTANALSDILLAQSIEDAMFNYFEEAEPLPAGTTSAENPPISIVERAEVPTQPSGPGLPFYAALALVGGLLAGSGLAFFLENSDNRLRSRANLINRSNLPVLGEITHFRKRRERVFLDGEIQAEDFRRMRTMLLLSIRQGAQKTILVTSGDVQEGKSVVAANLALALARTGLNVLLVDADMRRPAQHDIFRLSGNDPGLSNVLTMKKTAEEVIRSTQFPGLFVLSSGPYLENPADLLDSQEMTGLLERMKQQYDLIVLDSPAFLHVPDVVGLSSSVDGVLLVVRSNHTQDQNLKALLQQLNDQNAPVLGVVLNDARHEDGLQQHPNYYAPRVPTNPHRGNGVPAGKKPTGLPGQANKVKKIR